jgi:hypothetical protein
VEKPGDEIIISGFHHPKFYVEIRNIVSILLASHVSAGFEGAL